MKIVWIGDDIAAWFEPENDADRALIERGRKENWDTQRMMAEMSQGSAIAGLRQEKAAA